MIERIVLHVRLPALAITYSVLVSLALVQDVFVHGFSSCLSLRSTALSPNIRPGKPPDTLHWVLCGHISFVALLHGLDNIGYASTAVPKAIPHYLWDCQHQLWYCWDLYHSCMLLPWPGGFYNGRGNILCLRLTSKALIFCASGVLITGKLGFSFGARAARRFLSNIYNNMLECGIEFVIIERGVMCAINTDMACAFLANRNYHFKIFWPVLLFCLLNFLYHHCIKVDKMAFSEMCGQSMES